MSDQIVENRFNLPQPNFISLEHFLAKPTQIKKFDPQNPVVNRENFMDWLILSFYLDKGIVMAQLTFFEWTRLHSGFDYNQTLTHFFDTGKQQGNWDFLVPEEQQEFATHFKRVAGHFKDRDITKHTVTIDRMFLMLSEILTTQTDPQETRELGSEGFPNFLELRRMNYAQLRVYTDALVKKTHQKLSKSRKE